MPPAPAAACRLRPLSTAPRQQLAGLRGVLTDIDDTLTRDGAIEPVALRALESLAEARIPVIAITGRPALWSEPCARQWPVAAIVAENGAVLLRRTGAALEREFTIDEPTRRVHGRRLADCAAAVLAEVPGTTLARDSPGRLTDIAIDHGEFAQLTAAQIDQVVQVMRRHGLTATVSSIHVNGWLGDHDKWSGARWAVERALGVTLDAAEWLYVGDSTNDQLMFEHLPLSVGVANIMRYVAMLSVLPAYVTVGERGQGFAEVAAAVRSARSADA